MAGDVDTTRRDSTGSPVQMNGIPDLRNQQPEAANNMPELPGNSKNRKVQKSNLAPA